MIPIFKSCICYWVNDILRRGVIVNLFRNFKISYNPREDRVQRHSNITVLQKTLSFSINVICSLGIIFPEI